MSFRSGFLAHVRTPRNTSTSGVKPTYARWSTPYDSYRFAASKQFVRVYRERCTPKKRQKNSAERSQSARYLGGEIHENNWASSSLADRVRIQRFHLPLYRPKTIFFFVKFVHTVEMCAQKKRLLAFFYSLSWFIYSNVP